MSWRRAPPGPYKEYAPQRERILRPARHKKSPQIPEDLGVDTYGREALAQPEVPACHCRQLEEFQGELHIDGGLNQMAGEPAGDEVRVECL